jgi:hypothetical protein
VRPKAPFIGAERREAAREVASRVAVVLGIEAAVL